MGSLSRSRMFVIAALITAAILGGAYTLGHTLGRAGTPGDHGGFGGPGQVDAGSAYPADDGSAPSPDHAPDPGTDGRADRDAGTPPSASAPAPSPSASDAADGYADEDLGTAQPEEAQLPPEPAGPYGARLTTGGPAVALTFDDGPDPRYTPQTLAVLREFHVRATFCLVGENALAYPGLVRAIVADGHTLCNHSWDHDVALGSRSAALILADLTRTNNAIRAAVPQARIAYYRQPGGNWSPAVVAVARQLGMTSLHWTVDPRDWTLPGAGNIASMVTANAFPGAVVLLHDAGGNRQGTVNALYPILISLSRRFVIAPLPTGPAVPQPPTGTAPAAPPGSPSDAEQSSQAQSPPG
ncbi:polysaccharide deacetylase family protein [Plantactinospora sp. B5E13]|uniref:polysaccharide deacetylase family protein n=1 Tax=Plantactinospora sp. B5E13 TaxID=3153758 RepID=UPI00325DCFA8